jgi:hypothetical protein
MLAYNFDDDRGTLFKTLEVLFTEKWFNCIKFDSSHSLDVNKLKQWVEQAHEKTNT